MSLRLASVVMLAATCMANSACRAQPVPEPSSLAGPALRVVQTEPMPSPRAAHSATRLMDGRVLLAGGCNTNGCEEGIAADAIVFDPATSTFAQAAVLVQARVGHRAVMLADGSVLLFGGFTPGGVTDSVERYLPQSNRFEPHGRMLQPRDGFSATLLGDGSILLAGGYTDGMRRLATAERYDPISGRSHSVGAMSVERMSHTATLLPDGRVLLAGGSRSSSEIVSSIEIFDPATGTFSPAGALARPRHKHAAVSIGGRVLLLGGASIPEDDGHFADSEWWSSQGVGPGPRMSEDRYKFLDSLAMLDDGQMLIAGGGMHVEVLSADGTVFHPLEQMIGQRLAFTTVTALNDGRLLIAGGYDPDIHPTHNAWLLEGMRDGNPNTTYTD